jgi:hypothetical protein
MSLAASVARVGAGVPAPNHAPAWRAAGPGDDDDDDETPIGDPPDDDEGDDWDDEDEDDDEEPIQASGILRRSIATDEASRHNGVRLTRR